MKVLKEMQVNDIESEEIYTPEAKVVEATDFHPVGTGSSPVRSTRDFDWQIRTININGKNISRLGIS